MLAGLLVARARCVWESWSDKRGLFFTVVVRLEAVSNGVA